MRLGELLRTIGLSYDPHESLMSATQVLLRSADEKFHEWVPDKYMVHGSGGKGRPAICPWIAILDPRETTTAQRGLYVVYLFCTDRATVSLTLLQGSEQLHDEYGSAVYQLLERDARAIRSKLSHGEWADLDTSISLGSAYRRPRLYEKGTIYATTYDLRNLPSDDVLVADLQRFLHLYAAAVYARGHQE